MIVRGSPHRICETLVHLEDRQRPEPIPHTINWFGTVASLPQPNYDAVGLAIRLDAAGSLRSIGLNPIDVAERTVQALRERDCADYVQYVPTQARLGDNLEAIMERSMRQFDRMLRARGDDPTTYFREGGEAAEAWRQLPKEHHPAEIPADETNERSSALALLDNIDFEKAWEDVKQGLRDEGIDPDALIQRAAENISYWQSVPIEFHPTEISEDEV